MDATTFARASSRPAAARPISAWRKRTIAALVTAAALYLFLELVVTTFATKEAKEPAVFVLAGIDLVLAALLLRVRQGWLSLVAVAFLLLGMIGAAPHDLGALIHPDDPAHFVFSVLIFGVLAAGIISAIQDFRHGR